MVAGSINMRRNVSDERAGPTIFDSQREERKNEERDWQWAVIAPKGIQGVESADSC